METHIGETIRNKLHSGQRVYGTHVMHQSGPMHLNLMAQLSLDFVFLDTEHIPVNRTEISYLCQHFSAHGISPIVRIAYPNPNLASQAIDGGAQGIVVPYVETVEEVKSMVGAVKYRPLKGKLLRDILHGSRKLNPKTSDYLQRYNRNLYLIIGVESVEAYQNLDAILNVPGVDGIFIGPHDLTTSMEIPEEYDHPAYMDTLIDIYKRCREKGVGVGLHAKPAHVQAQQYQEFIEAGMNWILYYHDQMFMFDAMQEKFREIRKIGGDD